MSGTLMKEDPPPYSSCTSQHKRRTKFGFRAPFERTSSVPEQRSPARSQNDLHPFVANSSPVQSSNIERIISQEEVDEILRKGSNVGLYKRLHKKESSRHHTTAVYIDTPTYEAPIYRSRSKPNSVSSLKSHEHQYPTSSLNNSARSPNNPATSPTNRLSNSKTSDDDNLTIDSRCCRKVLSCDKNGLNSGCNPRCGHGSGFKAVSADRLDSEPTICNVSRTFEKERSIKADVLEGGSNCENKSTLNLNENKEESLSSATGNNNTAASNRQKLMQSILHHNVLNPDAFLNATNNCISSKTPPSNNHFAPVLNSHFQPHNPSISSSTNSKPKSPTEGNSVLKDFARNNDKFIDKSAIDKVFESKFDKLLAEEDYVIRQNKNNEEDDVIKQNKNLLSGFFTNFRNGSRFGENLGGSTSLHRLATPKDDRYIRKVLDPLNSSPLITVTVHSEEALNKSREKGEQESFKYGSLLHLGDEIHYQGFFKEAGSPPPRHDPGGSTSTYLRDQIISFFQPSDNKLAMKLFGNKSALMKEKLRQKAAGNWVIHPCSNFRFYWDLFMLVLLIANLIILPVAISFFNDDLSTHWIVFNGISDTVFLLDLIINFRTGIIADNFADDIILEPREIAKHYLRTWFFLDLISSIPMDYIILIVSPEDSVIQLIHAGKALRIFRLVKLLSLLRLLRLSRLVRYVSQWEEDIGQFLTVASKFMRIFNLVALILLLGHWNGCLQWLVPMLQEFPRDSWAALEQLQNAHWTEQYTWALFKALSHMLCIGYGRYPPQSTTDVWLTTVSMLTGATCYALFVGHSTTLIQSFDTSRRLYREKFKQVEEYMIYRKLPRKLRQRISDYYEHRYQGKMFDELSILAEVNECLREEIINFNCRALVASVPFFTHADPNFVSDVVTNLRYEMFQPGDYIIREGSIGTKVYFIQEGIVDIITTDDEVATSLSDGSYFGEICLLANTKRTASVRAETYCNLFSLTVEHFDAVLERYPLMRRTMESVAAERLNKIGKDPSILTNREDLEADISMVNELIMQATPLPSSDSEDSSTNHINSDFFAYKRSFKKKKKYDKQRDNDKNKDREPDKQKDKDTLTVKIASILRRSRSNLNVMRQNSEKE